MRGGRRMTCAELSSQHVDVFWLHRCEVANWKTPPHAHNKKRQLKIVGNGTSERKRGYERDIQSITQKQVKMSGRRRRLPHPSRFIPIQSYMPHLTLNYMISKLSFIFLIRSHSSLDTSSLKYALSVSIDARDMCEYRVSFSSRWRP